MGTILKPAKYTLNQTKEDVDVAAEIAVKTYKIFLNEIQRCG